ncbi:MAG: hypothetical protein ACK5MG_07145 [Bacteroidales bacterium]
MTEKICRRSSSVNLETSKIRSRGAPAVAKDPTKTSVMNIDVKTKGTTHSNIDERTQEMVIYEIKANVERRYD